MVRSVPNIVDLASAADYDNFNKNATNWGCGALGERRMNEFSATLSYLRNERLAAYAVSALPAWLWSVDATRILWANPTAAAIFDVPSPAALIGSTIDPKGTAALQIARLAGSLPHGAAPRLERLRGLGAPLGRALTCACSRITLADHTRAILVVAAEPAGPKLSLEERARRLLIGSEDAAALFSADGTLLAATANAKALLNDADHLTTLGATALGSEALGSGHAGGVWSGRRFSVARLGADGNAVLLAVFAAVAETQQPSEPPHSSQIASTPAPSIVPSVQADVKPAAPTAESEAAHEVRASQPVQSEPTVETLEPATSEGHAGEPDGAADVKALDARSAAAETPPPEAFDSPESEAPPAPPSSAAKAATTKDEPPAAELPTDHSAMEQSVADSAILESASAESPTIDQPTIDQPNIDPPKTEPPAPERRASPHPLRIVWQMDVDGRFTIDSPAFAELIGPTTAAALGQTWGEIAAKLGLDDDGQIERAFASHQTWSGLTALFPVDGSRDRLAVEMSGLPVFDRDRSYRGYRGFGICRDTARLAELTQLRRAPEPATVPPPREEPPVLREERPTLSVVPASPNVVPFRSSTPEKPPTLTPVERSAFRELASELTARLRGADRHSESEAPADTPAAVDEPDRSTDLVGTPPPVGVETPPDVLANIRDERPTSDQRSILDRLPVGVLVYRLDNLVYANRAFLDWTGYSDLQALTNAGGLDALFVEAGVDAIGANGTQSLAITTQLGDTVPVEARLFSTPWEGESALVLMLAHLSAIKTSDSALQRVERENRELRAILEAATDGVVVLDHNAQVLSINHSAETSFGYDNLSASGMDFSGLFAPESQRIALDLLGQAAAYQPSDGGRELAGRRREGGLVPLFVTVSRIPDSEKFCAVFRDISRWKRAEEDLIAAKRTAESASAAKSDFLAKVSHEIRTPLNAIIGFSEVMMEERFGPVGNDRYKQYLRDINASGEHLISLLNDLLDLSKIEAGKLDLTFADLELNELTQQCVALMQPQANRERIIIRTSLSSSLPPVVADARSVRQIVLNLLSNSIKFNAAGGQVIVSTALNDAGDVVLRVRDTGVGMSEKDIAIALEPFRQLATSARWGSSGTGIGLPLTKALAEANRATFNIKSTINAGTLVEVSFPGARMAAE